MRSSRDDLIKDLDAKNAEISDMMTKAKEHLDKITAEKGKLEIEYTELKKTNAVSILCMYQRVHIAVTISVQNTYICILCSFIMCHHKVFFK